MMKRFFSTIIIAAIAICSGAQTPQNIRYVCNNNAEVKKADGTTLGYHVKGKYENDGRSWATAKENIQDAINDLVANGLTGEVWVAEGTYTPTESTESSGGSTLYMSFKIPAGITVRGGFHGLLTKTQDADPTENTNIALAGEQNANTYHKDDNPSGREMNSTTSSSIGESTKYRTTLSGTLNETQDPLFEYNENKGQFDTQFYGNCYHVVYFATNGFDENGRAKALVGSTPAETATALSTPQKGETEGAGYVAKLEGVIVKNGNAKNTALEGHPHNAYGGGVYMVPGSMVENVYFTNCEASRDGGAIYMDGGGIVRHCYIADCQALGTDLTSGYGGGLCADENKQLYPTQITRTTVANCVARYGGGMASKVTNTKLAYKTPSHTYDMKYNTGFGANLITGCTATTEGGGVYSYQGGAWTHMTIVNNRCNGSGVTINGMKTGQSAGIYVRDDAIIANSILWGGTTKAANDEAKSAQFALSRSTSKAEIDVRYVALSNVDNTNWSGVKKDNVIMLSNYNTHATAETAGVTEADGIKYPYFINPSNTVGHEDNGATLNYLPSTGGAGGGSGYSYKISYSSAASYAGILTNDLDYEDKTPAKDRTIDIQGNTFGVYPSLGAYVSEEPHMAPSVEYYATLSDGTTGNIAHIYVDPNSTYLDNAKYLGSSWASPIRNLSDALSVIEKEIQTIMSAKVFDVSEIHVHVKEGTVDMSGVLSTGSVRSGSLVIPDVSYKKGEETHHLVLKIMGGYDQSLSYTANASAPQTSEGYLSQHDISKRNPILTPTVITGKVLNDYKYYIPHLVKIDGKQNVTIDGFQLRYANARSQELEATTPNGAAFTINNSSDITIKNVLVAGCTADNGAVVYATGSASSPTVVNFENCIFHNNETTYTETSGNVYCDGSTTLNFNHCDILRNVGYPFYTASSGQVTMTNSIVYANMSVPVDDTNNYGVANDGQPTNTKDRSLVAFKGAGTYSGNTNLFDLKSRGQLPTGMNRIEPWLQFNFAGGSNDKYPFFCNPTKNAGVSVSGDDTYYGRATSFQPHNGNPMVNTASHDGTHNTWGTDMSTTVTRDYGGLPDIGAIENHRAIEGEGTFGYSDGFPAYGTQWYVRDYGADDLSIEGRDGMSWETAINGNGLYDSGQTTITNHALPISWATINAMANGDSKTVMLANPHKKSGYVLGYNGTSALGNGKGFTLSSDMIVKVDEKVNDNDYKFTLTKTGDNTYTLKSLNGEKSPNYNGSGVSWGDASNFTLPQVTGYGSTSDFMSDYSSDYTIRFAQNVNNYLNAFGSPGGLTYRAGTGEWSVWYVFEVTSKESLVEGVEGLQYAVEQANEAFLASGGTYGHEKEVWVGAGTYSRDPYINETSCFEIKDGVKVYGAFPKTGNPGKEQREPLCSQYVKETKSRTVADYETILQPKTASTTAGTTHRVLGQPYASNPVNGDATVTYHSAEWDGFTLHNGVLDIKTLADNSQNTDRIGGAAATVYSHVTLRNMVANNNQVFYTGSTTDSKLRGGGFYVDGGTIESSYIINNTLGNTGGLGDGFGGGIYLHEGTVYNSVIAYNTINATNADGAGTAIFGQAVEGTNPDGTKSYNITTNYFNNTVIKNVAKGTGRMCGGVAQVNTNSIVDENDNHCLVQIYNCIVLKNEGYSMGKILAGYKDFAVQLYGNMQIHNCATENDKDPTMTQKCTMSFTNCKKPAATDLFVSYADSNPFAIQDLHLKSTAVDAINTGNSSPSVNGSIVDLSSYTDMDNKDRILDCTIDMGAFEYDNAYAITPDLTSESGRAIYYVTPEGRLLASAENPTNPACAAKLQRVLDAAGRYKYLHPETQVIVKVATKKQENTQPYVRPGSVESKDASKDDLNTIANQKQYLTGLEMVIEQPDGTTKTDQALSGLTFNKSLNDMYVEGNHTVEIYSGKKVTFNFQFPSGYGVLKDGVMKSCLVESIWIDTNGDKVFNKLIGRVGKQYTWTPNSNLESVTFTIPEGMTSDATRIRIRLETPWSINYTDANAQTNRIVYDIPVKALNGTSSPASFQYYANRTVNDEDQDIRLWSIIVPRGVEVWGGYSDEFSTDNENGFWNKNNGTYVGGKDKRDILGNPVYFDAAYYNKAEGTNAVTYHVVSFADKVFDGNGSPYHQDDVVGEDAKAENSDKPLLTMISKTSDRAVVDGIFIQGGTADANAGAASGSVNINQYGGAAIVTDYAHVRNCIVRNNKGFYGGAFALTHGALISGTLIEKNSADYGGAVYVFENGTKLSNGTTVNTGTTAADNSKMPHVYTSTIVNNKAEKQGGGLWFTDDYSNVRINSTVLWQNQCNDEANVYGLYSPEKADDQKSVSAEAFFPFAYSAIQNMRVSGTNNMSVETSNSGGIRIWKNQIVKETATDDEITASGGTIVKTKADIDENAMATDQSTFSDFGYWRPTSYSVLLNTGMPTTEYTSLISTKGLAAADFATTDRLVSDNGYRTYVDIGARALMKPRPTGQLMLRLFVAKPEDVDINAAETMMKLEETNVTTTGLTDADRQAIARYYKQEGSSFAYPFQSLQDALDYVVWARSSNMNMSAADIAKTGNLDKAVDVPFEIYVAKGEYYPTKDLVGHYGESLSNTFAIPEGVNIYGGFNCQGMKNYIGTLPTGVDKNKAFFGGYQAPDVKEYDPNFTNNEYYVIENNVKAPDDLVSGSTFLTLGGYNILLCPTTDVLPMRPKTDINKNSIIEPWEFENQTILSGNTTNESADGVYHVVTAVPDENVVGQLPKPSAVAGKCLLPEYIEKGNTGYGYIPKEYGQGIILNGLTIMGGYAENYKVGQLDNLSKNIYFKGGGLVADGNRYNNSYNEAVQDGTTSTWTKTETQGYKHDDVTNNIAYRDVPIVINGCKFRDNVAGFGGAIAANCELNIYNSSFENNMALAGSDTNVDDKQIDYPGQGGAILCSYSLSAYNTVFANNEARDNKVTSPEMRVFKTMGNQTGANLLGGAGGAIYIGKHGNFHIINCNIVRNKANAYPAVFTMNPNYYNSEWNSGEACYVSEYNQLENTVIWGNELNTNLTYSEAQRFAASLICNYGLTNRILGVDYNPAFDGSVALPTAADFATDASKDVLSRKWMETAWFCAYEAGRGIPANNAYDMRKCDHDFTKHIMYTMGQQDTNSGSLLSATKIPYQNSNIVIDSENGTLEGPNFGNPSKIAGTDGYREDTDWSPARICNLTDNGSGMLEQNDARDDFNKNADGTYINHGTYTAARYATDIAPANMFLPIGTDPYMTGAGTGMNIQRISFDPNPTHDQTYIDIGAYEYVHTKLEPTTIGDEVDILWVSNEEKYGNGKPDGSTWAQPTSDLQRAIETLLASRNGHRKEVRLMEGEYSPVYTINGHQSFYIDTKYLNASVELPKDGAGNLIEGRGVKSFTIKGGYSKDLMNQYDVTLYPSVIKTKTRSNSTEDDWDHAIYIADATQRYGIEKPNEGETYTAVKGYGWWAEDGKTYTTDDSKIPTTVPIQIDGVSVVNNQALTTANGAAIYYADQSFNTNGEQEYGAIAYLAVAPVDAHVTTAGTTDDIEGHTYATKTKPAKLILSKTHVYDSGAHDGSKNVSAVYIGKYGGETLIYNNVFHSNYGDPLVAYAAKTINNTYALNEGKVDLKNNTGNSTYDAAHPYTSTIMNSALWKNNPTSGKAKSADAFGEQFALEGLTIGEDYSGLTSSGSIFAYNAYTGGNTEAVDYDDAEQFIGTHNHNVGLVNGNSDAIYGPNFADPENADVSKRSFKLLPSLRLLNKGSNDIYKDVSCYASTSPEPSPSPAGEGWGGASYAWVPTVMKDAAGQYRIMVKTNGVIDVGALEYQTQQNRILYVDPSKTLSGEGLSWGDALGYGNIQAAIDLAAVYYKNVHKEAYVFVKAAPTTNKDLHTGETITLRNGVSIYGSVSSDFKTNCNSNIDVSGNISYTESDIADYIKDVTIYNRGGIINPSSGQTRINGINTNGTAFDNTATCLDDGDGNAKLPTALVDGFVVTNAEAVKAPVIKIAPKTDDTNYAEGGLKMCLRNIAVYGNDYSGGEEGNTVNPNNNLVDINSALLYEVLMHSNKVKGDASILKVGAHGYVVNATVEGKTTGADNISGLNNVVGSLISGSADGTAADAISNNSPVSHVYNSITNYASDEATWKTLSGYCYKMEDQNLNYQLTENSKYIDACGTANPMASTTLVTIADDRDALASFINYDPVYTGTLASGKWTSADKDLLGNFRLQTLGAKVDGAHSSLPGGEGQGGAIDRGAFETWKVTNDVLCVYPDYPHDGSVEYIMQGKSLIIDPIVESGDPRATAHVPGFILLQEGASLYGNGRPVHASYLALERKVNKLGSVVAMPHSMDYVKSQVLTGDANTTVGVATRTYDDNGIMSMTNDAGNVWQYDGSKRSDWKYAFASSSSPCWKAVSEGTVIPAAQGVLYEPSNTYTGSDVLRFTYRGTNLSDYIYKEESTTGASGDRHYYQTVTLTKYDDSESTSGSADFTEAEDQGWNCIGLPYLVNGYSTIDNATATDNVHGASASGKYMMQNPHTMWLYYDGKKYSDGTTAANGDGGFYSVSSWQNTAEDSWHLASTETATIFAGEGFFVQNLKFSGDETLTFYRPIAPTLGGGSGAKGSYNSRYYVVDGIKEIDKPISFPDGESQGGAVIKVIDRILYISNLVGGEDIRIYTSDGRLVHVATADSESYTTSVNAGFIIVTVNSQSKKILVK